MGKLKLFVAGLALATTGVLGLGAPAGAADGAQGGDKDGQGGRIHDRHSGTRRAHQMSQ